MRQLNPHTGLYLYIFGFALARLGRSRFGLLRGLSCTIPDIRPGIGPLGVVMSFLFPPFLVLVSSRGYWYVGMFPISLYVAYTYLLGLCDAMGRLY